MKKTAIILMAGIALGLSGCGMSDFDEAVNCQIEEESGIKNDEDYKQYEALKNDNKLNESDEYIENAEAEDDVEQIDGTIHVTVATNSNMNIKFYKDKELTQELGASFYMNPGDELYSSDIEIKNETGGSYVFDHYRICECDTNDKVVQIKDWVSPGGNVVMKIPGDFNGTELMVQPIGRYNLRNIKFKAYCYDAEGSKKNVSGKWWINDELKSEDNGEVEMSETDILATKTNIVSYTYDNDSYYVVSSTPEYWDLDENDGKITFRSEDLVNGVNEFDIELHKYIDVSINIVGSDEVTIDSQKYKIKNNNQTFDLGRKWKVGDKIKVEAGKKIAYESDSLECGQPEDAGGKYIYTFTVKDIVK